MKNLSYKDKKDAELLQVIAVFKGNEAAAAFMKAGMSPDAVAEAGFSLMARTTQTAKGKGKGQAKNRSED